MADVRRFQDLGRFRMPQGFRGRSAITVQFWWIVQETLFRWSPQALYPWRNFLLRIFGAKIGKAVKVRPTVRITYPWNLSIGDEVWIGDDAVLYNLGEIVIGSSVAISHRVYLCTGLHDYTKIAFPIMQKPIHIEDEVWLTNDIFVAPGVTIRRGAVVGARSTVLGDLPSGMICYGYPAKPVRPRVVDG